MNEQKNGIMDEKKGNSLKKFDGLRNTFNLNEDFFEPCKNTPPNEFLIKLYKRFKMHESEYNPSSVSSISFMPYSSK